MGDVSYHPSGQVREMTYGNGMTTTVDFDDRARTKTITSPTSPEVIGLSYGYDGADNVISFDNTAVPGSARTMTYDGLDRVYTVTAANQWGTAAYSYDEVGNRTWKSTDASFTEFVYDGQNRLSSADGGLEGLRPMTLTWDLAGRLAWSSDGTAYQYDGLGRRVWKADAAQTTLYHYDAAGRIVSETLPDGTRLRDFIYLGNRLVAVLGCIEGPSSSTCGGVQWYHTDTLGSVLARTDESGAVVARFDYQPWGETWSAAGLGGDRQYNGRVFDAGTGFHDYGARYYWPEIGRFISSDTAGPDLANPASCNKYSYVWNSPYKYADPSGRDPVQSRILENPTSYSYLERSGLADGLSVGYLSEHGLLRDAVSSNGGNLQGLQQSEQDLLNVEQAFAVGVFPSLAGAAVSTLGTGAVARRSTATDSAGSNLSTEAQRGIRSLEQRIAEHEQKLAEFKANPTVRPGMEKLPVEVIRKQQQARIQHLEKEIQTFKDNIDKLKGGGQ